MIVLYHLQARAAPGLLIAAKRGAAEGIRTPDPRITNAVLYQLSYSGNDRTFSVPWQERG